MGVAANSDIFQFYKSGIITSSDCGNVLNHALLIVGFTGNYWIAKNSWGTSWGEDGYVKIGRSNGGPGICGIASYPWAVDVQ